MDQGISTRIWSISRVNGLFSNTHTGDAAMKQNYLIAVVMFAIVAIVAFFLMNNPDAPATNPPPPEQAIEGNNAPLGTP